MLKKKHPCHNCTTCCEHIALPLDKPTDKEDWNHILWYISHEGVNIYTDFEGDWFIEIKTKCKLLNQKGMCDIYDGRPSICKEYSWEECEKHGEGNFFNVILRTRKDVIAYIKKNTKIKNLD